MLNTFDTLLSVEQQVALLTDEEIDRMLEGLDAALLRWSWEYTARADQLAAVDDDARVVGLVGGRGSGKTRTGAEWIRRRVGRGKPVIFGLIGRTAGDVRDTMIQGESGILSVFPPSEMPTYTATSRRVDFVDGSYALCFSAETPSQLRGPQFHYAWADELAAWDLRPDNAGTNAWDNVNFATRLGRREGIKSQILFTTTPKRIALMREILEKAKHGRRFSIYNQAGTDDNPHLDPEAVEELYDLYADSRLADQELRGVLGGDVVGALWNEKLIQDHRVGNPGRLPIRVVGVDPTTADNPRDECGIIAVGITPKAGPVLKRTGYVLADRSLRATPSKWAKVVVETAREFEADVVAEANQGGAMVREVIHNIDDRIPVRLVHASVSKKMRADPVSVATEKGRLKFAGRFPLLEDQMTTWVPDVDTESPDRVDALVHAVAGFITLSRGSRRAGGAVKTSNPARGRQLQLGGMVGRR